MFKPNELAKFYNFPQVSTHGTSIGIIELGGGFAKDQVNDYLKRVGLDKKANIVVNGPNRAIGRPGSADSEVYLDIEVIAAIAPDTEIRMYFAENDGGRGFSQAVQKAVQDDCDAISISWGNPEQNWRVEDIHAMTDAFDAAKKSNIPVFAAAGDAGYQDGIRDGKPHVDFPASSPDVIGCGGIRLVIHGQSAEQTVWDDSCQSATGGGTSKMFPKPDYQKKLTLPDGNNHRGVPDIAGVADPQTGYIVESDHRTFVEGGTSAVSPLYSALYVKLMSQVNLAKKDRPNFLEFLYANQDCFTDITQGNNGKYPATKGYDCCTGLGVPKPELLAKRLSKLKKDPKAKASGSLRLD